MAQRHEQTPLPFSVEGEHDFTPEFHYELLTGHRRTDGSIKTTDQLHTEYLRLTDELVRKCTEGVEIYNEKTGETDVKKPDFIVWLDKSARPVSWLMNETWNMLAANADGTVPPKPASRFVNIDRNQWRTSVDPQGGGITDVAKIDKSIIRSLRSVFLTDPRDRLGGLTDDIDKAPTQFDNKTVLIVDEVLSSGLTLEYAKQFFKRAFPDANVAGTHWMGKVGSVSGRAKGTKGMAIGNADLPVWYREDTVYGRGIGNRNEKSSLRSENSVQRLGAWFLSNALKQPDPLSDMLRRELHQLAEDARLGKVFVEPSIHRDIDDYDERALRLNKINDFQEFLRQKYNLASK